MVLAWCVWTSQPEELVIKTAPAVVSWTGDVAMGPDDIPACKQYMNFVNCVAENATWAQAAAIVWAVDGWADIPADELEETCEKQVMLIEQNSWAVAKYGCDL